ncbi:MAG: hypothetical protein J6Y53_01745 [Alphaproteobacteria bacterium]|nr:hypothetical protein [Alphaproteobacteria bacterium]
MLLKFDAFRDWLAMLAALVLCAGCRLWHLVSLRLLKAALAQQDVPKSLQTKTTGATVVFA